MRRHRRHANRGRRHYWDGMNHNGSGMSHNGHSVNDDGRGMNHDRSNVRCGHVRHGNVLRERGGGRGKGERGEESERANHAKRVFHVWPNDCLAAEVKLCSGMTSVPK